jgi:K+-sensing histidine kinase KdpD
MESSSKPRWNPVALPLDASVVVVLTGHADTTVVEESQRLRTMLPAQEWRTPERQGPGLSIGHPIADEHGGSTRLENLRHGGARVPVDLPAGPVP